MDNISSSLGHTNDFLNADEKLTLALLLSSLTTLGIITNAFVVYVIISLGTYVDIPANLFMLSQAVAHLGNTVSVSCFIVHMHYWNWEATYILFSFTLLSSLGSLCLLTINRLLSIAWTFKYSRWMTPLRAKLLVALIWIAALLITLLHLIGYLVYSNGNFFNYGRYYMMLLIVVFVSSNLYMFCKSRQHARKIYDTTHRVITGQQRNIREDLKSVKTIAMVSATFLLGWFPLMLMFYLYGDEKEKMDFQRYNAFFSPLMALNIVSDPLIYYFRSPEFRMFYQRWKRRRGLGTKKSHVVEKGLVTHSAFIRSK